MDAERYYRQDATYWDITGSDDFGKDTYGPPVVFRTNWVDETQELQGNRGQTLISKAIVHIPHTLSVQEEGYLFKGISAIADPTTVPHAQRIMQTAELPDLRGLSIVKVAYV